jgi:hypothetical protein
MAECGFYLVHVPLGEPTGCSLRLLPPSSLKKKEEESIRDVRGFRRVDERRVTEDVCV